MLATLTWLICRKQNGSSEGNTERQKEGIIKEKIIAGLEMLVVQHATLILTKTLFLSVMRDRVLFFCGYYR